MPLEYFNTEEISQKERIIISDAQGASKNSRLPRLKMANEAKVKKYTAAERLE